MSRATRSASLQVVPRSVTLNIPQSSCFVDTIMNHWAGVQYANVFKLLWKVASSIVKWWKVLSLVTVEIFSHLRLTYKVTNLVNNIISIREFKPHTASASLAGICLADWLTGGRSDIIRNIWMKLWEALDKDAGFEEMNHVWAWHIFHKVQHGQGWPEEDNLASVQRSSWRGREERGENLSGPKENIWHQW